MRRVLNEIVVNDYEFDDSQINETNACKTCFLHKRRETR